MTRFDLSKPDAEVICSPMGGGWIIPLTPAGTQALREFFNEGPNGLTPLCGQRGYIVEPYMAVDLAEYLRKAGITWIE